ncbi:MAG: ATP-binding protein [Gammaproteobacteria bacterium]|nr:MAG: ATP-binding protein [Gammaproteobacteria bacterium]
MTTYTNTRIGQITEVRPGMFSATLNEDSDGKLPVITVDEQQIPIGQPGSYVAITQGTIRVLAMVSEMTEKDGADYSETLTGRTNGKQRVVSLIPLGEINTGGLFESGVKNYPVAGAEVHAVSKDDIKSIFVKFRAQGYSVGTLSNDSSLDVCLDPAALFGRHCAILGQSGAGKSWAVTNLLQRAVKVMPRSHIILLDLHGEYAWKDREGIQHYAFDENVVRHIDARDLEMPYWLMTFGELVDLFIDRTDENASVQIAFLRDSVHDLRNKANKDLGIGTLSVDSPVYFPLDTLYKYFDEANKMTTNFGKEKGPLAGQFDQFLMRLESRMNDVRYDFMLRPKHRTSSDTLGDLLRDFVGLGDPKRPITVIDLSTVPFDVRPTVSAQVGRLAFEFNYWNPQYRDFPLLLVCEEAHAYIPRDNDPRYEGTRQSMQRIAKEGRKYGVGLAVVSQRPHELSETVLAQCSTFICLRLTNPDDQAYVRNLVPEAEHDLIDVLASLGRGEALTMGQAAPLPTRVQFYKPDPVPNSSDVDFYQQWISGPEDLDVEDIVDRWRRQDRLKSFS